MASSSPDAITEITAACLCGQLAASVQIAKSDLPIELWLCSCNTCRYTSGHLAITSAYSCRELSIKGEPVQYATSTGRQGLTRCFCDICGTTVYEDSPDVKRTGLCGGALSKTEGILGLKGFIFVADTKDGGLRGWMPTLPAHKEDIDSPEAGSYSSNIRSSDTSPTSTDKLHCECHCGGVQFQITRPNAASLELRAPYGDAFVPHYMGDACQNIEDKKWWISEDGNRYSTSICACVSCRKSSGYDLQSWSFVPKANILQPNGQTLDFSAGSLREYSSSDGVYRHFCGTCGATVFWRCDARGDLIDVSTGIMRAPSGACAEEWLEWQTKRISFVEFAENEPLFEALDAGFKAWNSREK